MYNQKYYGAANNPMQQGQAPLMPHNNQLPMHHGQVLPPHIQQQQQQQQQQMQYQQFYQQQLQLQQSQIARDDSLFKLKRLDEIQASISKLTHMLIQFFDETTKNAYQQKVKQTKNVFDEFLKQLKKVEQDLLHEINLLGMASTGNPHEGSIYGARKDYDLSKMQLNLITAQINSLANQLNAPLQQDVASSDSSSDEADDEQDNIVMLNGHSNGMNEH